MKKSLFVLSLLCFFILVSCTDNDNNLTNEDKDDLFSVLEHDEATIDMITHSSMRFATDTLVEFRNPNGPSILLNLETGDIININDRLNIEDDASYNGHFLNDEYSFLYRDNHLIKIYNDDISYLDYSNDISITSVQHYDDDYYIIELLDTQNDIKSVEIRHLDDDTILFEQSNLYLYNKDIFFDDSDQGGTTVHQLVDGTLREVTQFPYVFSESGATESTESFIVFNPKVYGQFRFIIFEYDSEGLAHVNTEIETTSLHHVKKLNDFVVFEYNTQYVLYDESLNAMLDMDSDTYDLETVYPINETYYFDTANNKIQVKTYDDVVVAEISLSDDVEYIWVRYNKTNALYEISTNHGLYAFDAETQTLEESTHDSYQDFSLDVSYQDGELTISETIDDTLINYELDSMEEFLNDHSSTIERVHASRYGEYIVCFAYGKNYLDKDFFMYKDEELITSGYLIASNVESDYVSFLIRDEAYNLTYLTIDELN